MTQSAEYTLQIAMQLERLGQTFYQSLAAGCGNAEISALAAKLADDEKKHLWSFQRMYQAIPIDRCGPKLTEDQLTAAAGKFYKLILPSAEEVRKVAIDGDITKVLAMAMQMESDSIAFYLGMTASPGESAVIKNIVEEEKKHLRMLQEYSKKP